jgi:uncharacterized protein (TIGR03492 family)
MPPARLTFLSNGYGEDAIAALLAAEFKRKCPDTCLQAYPTVGEGKAFEALNIPILGPRKTLPSGGLLFHSLPLLLGDLRAGFLGMTARQLLDLRRLRTDVLVVVGDVYALLLSTLVRARARFYVQPLVSVYHRRPGGAQLNRTFMERYTGLERTLIRRAVTHMYVRDAPTAAYLEALGLPVNFLGNPMLNDIGQGERLDLSLTSPVMALLPGTRRYATASLKLMLSALSRWPEATGLVAWAGEGLEPGIFSGWQITEPDISEPGLALTLARGQQHVYVFKNRFADVLHSADLALGTSGTANEQAAALGLPVVAFPLPPFYTKAFLHNQKRLLAEALTIAEAEPEAIAQALRALWQDRVRYQQAADTGRRRMGKPGGTKRIVRDILERLE